MSRREAQVMGRGRSLKQLRANDVKGMVFGRAEPNLCLANGDTKAHRLFRETNQSQKALWEASNSQHYLQYGTTSTKRYGAKE